MLLLNVKGVVLPMQMPDIGAVMSADITGHTVTVALPVKSDAIAEHPLLSVRDVIV